MKRSRTVYGGLDALDGLDGLTEHCRKEQTQFSSDAPLVSSLLTCDMLDKSNRFYHKSKRLAVDSVASENRLDGTDSESDASSRSCGEDVEVNDTNSINRVDRLLEIEINSVKTAKESDDNDSCGSFGDTSLFECSKVFGNPSRNDMELANDFNLLEVSA